MILVEYRKYKSFINVFLESLLILDIKDFIVNTNKQFMRSSICLILMLLSIPICGQSYPKLVIINKQHYFKRTVPKGNYSGITWLENNSYAIVSDKAEYSGLSLS